MFWVFWGYLLRRDTLSRFHGCLFVSFFLSFFLCIFYFLFFIFYLFIYFVVYWMIIPLIFIFFVISIRSHGVGAASEILVLVTPVRIWVWPLFWRIALLGMYKNEKQALKWIIRHFFWYNISLGSSSFLFYSFLLYCFVFFSLLCLFKIVHKNKLLLFSLFLYFFIFIFLLSFFLSFVYFFSFLFFVYLFLYFFFSFLFFSFLVFLLFSIYCKKWRWWASIPLPLPC